MIASSVRIVIVDDHPIFRAGLSRSLSEVSDFEIVGECASAVEAVALFRQHQPNVMLLDLSMPGGGHSVLQTLIYERPDATVIVLTASEDDADLFEALKEGARGYMLKGVDAATLVSVIRSVVSGESYVSPSLAARILTAMRRSLDAPTPFSHEGHSEHALSRLTPREEQILGLVSDGNSNKEVARHLGLQEKTIKHNMTRILQKLKARNRTEAAMFLRDSKLRP